MAEENFVGFSGVVNVVPEKSSSRNERSQVAWEDKSTGEYCRMSSGVKCDDKQYKRYTNVSVGNKAEGYSKRVYTEEKLKVPHSNGKSKSVKYYN